MNRLPDGTLRYSPQDLIAYLEGDFAAWCERLATERSRDGGSSDPTNDSFQRDADDDESKLAKRRGNEHETRYLEQLRQREPNLVEIPKQDDECTATLEAMRAGAPAIYQGHLAHGRWHGIPDFLTRVDGASGLGDWHYEPSDTKLARSAKPYFLIQLCAYANLLESLQGRRPAAFRFVLGDNETLPFKTDDFLYYFRQFRESFLAFQESWHDGAMPDPGMERSFGRWSTWAAELLEKSDHLSRVANISRSQIRRLEAVGISTLTELAATDRALVPKVSSDVFDRLKTQAAMQRQSITSKSIAWEIRPAIESEPRRGLALLPPPSGGDVFFDMEGFPYAANGLEYLFGAVYLERRAPMFRDWWAHDAAQERKAFEGFVDWVYARWQADPAMHIYHYASYEESALKRLMGNFATREFEVDQLLRHQVLVDLYNVVRQGLIIGTPSYSLKDIERLYMPARTEKVTSAGGSVVEYQRWLDSGESQAWNESPILRAIREYNRVDCESTWLLREWLLARQLESGRSWITLETPGGTGDPDARQLTPAESLAKELLGRAATLPEGEERRVTELLAWLVEFHRREEKPMWWRYFDRMEMTEDQLRDDTDCLAGLVRTDTPPRLVKRSLALDYRFDPDQDTKLFDGKKCIATCLPPLKCTIETMDCESGRIELKIGPGKTLPDRVNLIPDDHVSVDALKTAVFDYATKWASGQVSSQAVDDLLRRRAPRLRGRSGGALITEGGDLVSGAIECARLLDRSTLCIQGPPGTGKTTTAAAIIAALLQDGKRIGIAANSHQVVLNLLAAISRSADLPAGARLYKIGEHNDDALVLSGVVQHIPDTKNAAAAIATGPLVIGGTAWLFSRPDLCGTLDYLFIDEAGQVSLANAAAMGACATNLILVGDQMQLAQPTQGSHPGESGMSCLEYMLHGHATVPPELGIFLGRSYRMHPAVCQFISDAFYDSRLRSAPSTEKNEVILRAGSRLDSGTGITFVPVDHEGCTQGSDEEADTILELVQELLKGDVVIGDHALRKMTLNDVLIVAPFNMQVRKLRARLGPAARVGSVDKFQGQEAPVVIVSMCASTLEEAPRGAEFLLSPNRLNVALSRAQALAIVVGSPAIAEARCRSVEEMRLVNTYCRVMQYAGSGVH